MSVENYTRVSTFTERIHPPAKSNSSLIKEMPGASSSSSAAANVPHGATPVSESTPTRPPNHIRVTAHGQLRGFISYGLKLLQETDSTEVVLIAVGPAVNKGISVAEILKRKYPGLHQNTQIFYTKTVDMWEPTVPGLDMLQATRSAPSVQITLSKAPLDKKAPGYQPPLQVTI